jgi:hypothetical protein
MLVTPPQSETRSNAVVSMKVIHVIKSLAESA